MGDENPRISVLLGAGASADAGIPTTMEMTDAVIGELADREHRRVLKFIRYTIAAHLAQRRPDEWARDEPSVAVDVERLFAAVDLLVDRDQQPWSPFVGTWRSGLESFAPEPSIREFDLGVALRDVDRALIAAMSDTARRGSVSSMTSRILERPLFELLERAFKVVRPSDVSVLLADVRDEMLRSLFSVVRIADSTRVSYLSPLVELARKQGSLTIASLNYDRVIETLAELTDVRCDTAIESWSTQGELEWSESSLLRLLKLHGSIDWVADRHEPTTAGQLPLLRIRKIKSEDERAWHERPAVVFGEAGKLRAEGPFLELLLRWSAELRRADTLLVVGYSFRDAHVNEMIARWFTSEETRRIVLVDLADVASAEHPSLAWYLCQADNRAGRTDAPPVGRFQHVRGSTREVLVQGIQAARELG